MSFSNYGHFLYSPSLYFEFPLLQCPLLTFALPYPEPCPNFEPLSPSTQESKTQQRSKRPNFALLEEKLQKMHFGCERHRKCHWSAEEDKLLERLVEVQKLEWKQIPPHFEGRTQNMCYSRYRRISMCTKDRLWTRQEEDLVRTYVSHFGEKWKLISSKVPKFTSKQIRERYLNYLRPTINKEDFCYEQDLTLCRYVLEHGKHWRRMEEVLPGRSEGCIKGRYYGKLQRIIEQSLTNEDI